MMSVAMELTPCLCACISACHFYACSVSGGVIVRAMHTHHTHSYTTMAMYFIHLFMIPVSRDMHMAPSSLQDSTLPSAINGVLSKCTTLEKLKVAVIPF